MSDWVRSRILDSHGYRSFLIQMQRLLRRQTNAASPGMIQTSRYAGALALQSFPKRTQSIPFSLKFLPNFYQGIRRMKPVILLTGKNGQVGAELCVSCPKWAKWSRLATINWIFRILLTSAGQIREVRPQLIVNAAAYGCRQAETDERQRKLSTRTPLD